MSTVVVNSGGSSGGNGGGGGGDGGKGKKKDWMTTALLLGGVAIAGYIGSLVLAKKLGISVPKQTLPTDVDSLLAPPPTGTTSTPDQLAAIPPTPQPAGATTTYPPLAPNPLAAQYPSVYAPTGAVGPTPNPYQLNPFLGTTDPIALFGSPPPPGNLYPSQYGNLNALYPYNIPVAQTVTNAYLGETKHRWRDGSKHNKWDGEIKDWRGPNMGFKNKHQGEYDHGYRHGSEHDHNKNYEEIGDEYQTDTEDLELAVEEPYLHEMFGVNSHNADMADFDDLAFNESDECMTEEEMEVHVHSQETDYNDGKWGYAGEGSRHKHGKEDRQNRQGDDYKPSMFHMDMSGMGNEFKSKLVRDHKGNLMGLSN